MSRNPTRRDVMAGAASAALVSPVAASAAPDPVLAMIERHKAAIACYDAAANMQDRSEAHLNAACEAGGAADALALAMIETKPTTLAGILALMRYTANLPLDGSEWPDNIAARWPERFGHAPTLTWGDVVCGNLADALAGILAKDGAQS